MTQRGISSRLRRPAAGARQWAPTVAFWLWYRGAMSVKRPLKVARRIVSKVRKSGEKLTLHSAAFRCAACGAMGTCWDDDDDDAERATRVARCPSCGARNGSLTRFAWWTAGRSVLWFPVFTGFGYGLIVKFGWWLLLLLGFVTESPWVGYVTGGLVLAFGGWMSIGLGVGEYREARDAVVRQ